MLKTVFMGSPPLAVRLLETLYRDYGKPALVVSQAAKPAGRGRELVPTAVETWAREKRLEVLATDNANADDAFARIAAVKPDVLVVAAFGQILRDPLLTLPKRYCLNVHASILPKYRGAAPIQRALENGDTRTGVTIQRMAKKLDTGDILLVKETDILPFETSADLLEKLAKVGAEALLDALRKIERGEETFTPQDEAKATYAAKITKEEAEIDWTQPATRIRNKIRALQPWPIAESKLGGVRLKIFRAEEVSSAGGAPGSLHSDGKSELIVTCGTAALTLTEIQLENRKKLGIKEFLTAFRGQFPHNKMG